MENIKNIALAAGAAIGSVIIKMIGGWDTAMETLCLLMVADIITGIMVAAVFNRSNKTKGGAYDSRAGFKGACRKFAIFILIAIGTSLDKSLGVEYIRMGVIVFFLGNEGISLLENIGLMGVPFPKFLQNALEVLKDKGDNANEK